jgi:hypothetical protein
MSMNEQDATMLSRGQSTQTGSCLYFKRTHAPLNRGTFDVTPPVPPGGGTSGPTAASISVIQTIGLLDGPFSELAEGLARRQYGLWLGSGISRDRVDDLRPVIERVLKYLRDNANFADPNCKYVRALREALEFAHLSDADHRGFDPAQPFVDWKPLPTIVSRLRTNYARLLDIRVEHHPPDHLLWDVADVPGIFADASLEPDCEHLCIALLVIEGALADVASANWDGLIEKAIAELTLGATDVLRVCVRPDDFREPPLRARLMKFHGCAVRARDDPATYRLMLVGRQSQILSWPHIPETAFMRQQLVSLATTSPTLMVGLSAQDSNIKDVFVQAVGTMNWRWPSHPPAYIFAEEALGADQRDLLKCVYRDAYDAHPRAIDQGAQIRAFAKPLLTALVLDLMYRKLVAYIRQAPATHMGDVDFEALGAGLRRLRDRLAAGADRDRLAFIRAFVAELTRILDLFREGRRPPGGAFRYRPLGVQPANLIAGDPALVTSGLPELAAALGVLGLGETEGDWTLGRADPRVLTSGAVTVTPAGATVARRVFFAANIEAALQLYLAGVVRDDEPDVVILYSTAPSSRLPRSPRAAPGRTGAVVTREVGIRSLLSNAATSAEFRRLLREEAVL